MGPDDLRNGGNAVIAHTTATVAPGGRLRAVRCEPPVTLRQVRAEVAGTCALCLVGSAAGPLNGDELRLEIAVLAGAHATIRASGAQLAQGRGNGVASRVSTNLIVGANASLRGDTGPLVVAAGSTAHVDVDIDVSPTASLDWTELIVLGRTGEPAGHAVLKWNVRLDGRPLLRHALDAGDGQSSMVLTGHRVIASAVVIAPQMAADTVVLSPTAVAARLNEHAVLLTVLGNDAAQVTADIATLRDRAAAC
jgi:urease accessory protein